MGKRYHVKDDVWLERVGSAPDYLVLKAGQKVADFYFLRQVTKRAAVVDCYVMFDETGVCIRQFAQKFGAALDFLRQVDWKAPAPRSVEAFAA